MLKAGRGVGAQTVTLARRSPDARFVAIDVSAGSLAQAGRRADLAGVGNVEFCWVDIFALPFEHLRHPVPALMPQRAFGLAS